MITKKSVKANLEKKSTLFFQMGMVIALATLLVAFETGNTEIEAEIYSENTGVDINEEIVQITRTEIKKPKPPIAPEEIIIIEDTEPEIDDEFDFRSEIGINDGIILPEFDFEQEKNVEDPKIHVIVENMPQYHGGNESEFQKHVQGIVKYPETAADMGIQGRVIVSFVIDKNGKLTRPQILRSPDELLSNAVLAALKKTDTWKPGEQRARKVAVSFSIPVYFKLQ